MRDCDTVGGGKERDAYDPLESTPYSAIFKRLASASPYPQSPRAHQPQYNIANLVRGRSGTYIKLDVPVCIIASFSSLVILRHIIASLVAVIYIANNL